MNSQIKPFQNHVAGLLQGSYLSDNQSEASLKFDDLYYEKISGEDNGRIGLVPIPDELPV